MLNYHDWEMEFGVLSEKLFLDLEVFSMSHGNLQLTKVL